MTLPSKKQLKKKRFRIYTLTKRDPFAKWLGYCRIYLKLAGVKDEKKIMMVAGNLWWVIHKNLQQRKTNRL